MSFWACAQLEPQRTALALHCLALNGFETYCPACGSSAAAMVARSPRFPGYTFVLIVSGWWSARWAAGVRRLVMDGQVPARVPDAVIAEIRSRERNGFVELSKPARLAPGMRVRVISGPLHDQIGLLAVPRPHERVLVLMHLLGGEQRVELARSAIEAV
jgi:transcriptional antiterminator RfaH